MTVEIQVEEADAGSRVDVLLVRRVDGMSRAKARRMIEDGSIQVNGRRVRKGLRLCVGDLVQLSEMPAPSDFLAQPDPSLELVVRFEDPHLVIVDKPAGLPTHPLKPDERRTLAGALLARYPEMGTVGYSAREPGVLHRLDNDTSGVLLAARSGAAFDALRALLEGGAIEKRYEALIEGELFESIIDAPIASHRGDPRRVHVCIDPLDRQRAKARPARTEVRGSRPIGTRFTLLELRAPVAVRHQIRAHLAALGHPLAGDWLYGGPTVSSLNRHFLHASRIAFDHPMTGERVDVSSPLPSELMAVLEHLRREVS